MNKNKIKLIFLENNFEKVKSIKKIKIGFTNKVYSINDKFILKIYEDVNNKNNFEREVFLYNFFKDKIPVPKIILYDNSKDIYNKPFMIYNKIQGENLYSIWHLLNNFERRDIIKQLCKILKVINKTSCKTFVKHFELNPSVDWHKKVYLKIRDLLKKVEDKKLVSTKIINAIKNFVTVNHSVLIEQKIALVYWDTHFDNIIMKNNKIVGILDFERTELASIDYVLNIVKRMVSYPKKYMSKKFEKYAKKKDYSNLLIWFKEFYPELFEFKDLDKRLGLYSIEHDLNTLLDYPKSVELNKIIAKELNLNK